MRWNRLPQHPWCVLHHISLWIFEVFAQDISKGRALQDVLCCLASHPLPKISKKTSLENMRSVGDLNAGTGLAKDTKSIDLPLKCIYWTVLDITSIRLLIVRGVLQSDWPWPRLPFSRRYQIWQAREFVKTCSMSQSNLFGDSIQEHGLKIVNQNAKLDTEMIYIVVPLAPQKWTLATLPPQSSRISLAVRTLQYMKQTWAHTAWNYLKAYTTRINMDWTGLISIDPEMDGNGVHMGTVYGCSWFPSEPFKW